MSVDLQPSWRQRALIVEDLPQVRRGLRQVLLQAFPGIEIDEVEDIKGARAKVSEAAGYSVALIDLGLPDGSGVEVIRHIRQQPHRTLAIVTTIYDDDEHVFQALAAGADGYLLKEHAPEILVQHLTRLDQGYAALSPAVARRILAYFRQAPPFRPQSNQPTASAVRLTARETEVLSLIGRGLQRGEVANILGIAENTVAKYVKEIYRKLDISSRAEAALEAQRRGLV